MRFYISSRLSLIYLICRESVQKHGLLLYKSIIKYFKSCMRHFSQPFPEQELNKQNI